MSLVLDGVAVPLSPPALEPDPRGPSPRVAPVEGPSDFERLLGGLGRSIDRGERVVGQAAGGYASRDAAELIALQAGIYRYSEAVDLSAKLVDRATSAVRTVLQGGQ